MRASGTKRSSGRRCISTKPQPSVGTTWIRASGCCGRTFSLLAETMSRAASDVEVALGALDTPWRHTGRRPQPQSRRPGQRGARKARPCSRAHRQAARRSPYRVRPRTRDSSGRRRPGLPCRAFGRMARAGCELRARRAESGRPRSICSGHAADAAEIYAHIGTAHEEAVSRLRRCGAAHRCRASRRRGRSAPPGTRVLPPSACAAHHRAGRVAPRGGFLGPRRAWRNSG